MKIVQVALSLVFWVCVAVGGALWIIGGNWAEWAALGWCALVGLFFVHWALTPVKKATAK